MVHDGPNLSHETAHVVIVGGGISGLSAAFYLQRQAREAGLPLRYTLVERAGRFGGKLVTDTIGEFVVEGGPDSILTQKPWGLQLVRELGLQDQLIGTNDLPRKVYFLANRRPVPMPEGMTLIVPTRLGPFLRSSLLSPLGKLRMLLDLIIPARQGDADETLADFIRRRFGREALLKLAEPLLAGIHNSESERQSLLATFPRLREIERQHGSLIRGMRAARRKMKDEGPKTSSSAPQGSTLAFGPSSLVDRSAFVTLKGGIGALAEALIRALEGRVIGGMGVAALDYAPGASQPYRLRLEDGVILDADAVILTAPAFDAADIVEGFQPELAAGLRQIRYVTTGTLSLAYAKQEIGEPLDGYGLVIPRTERRRINAVTISSAKFAHRAPDDSALVRVFVGGSRYPEAADLDDGTLVELARAELRDILGIRAEPLWSKIYRWPRSNPQYDVGHLARIDALEALCPAGLYLAGSAYRGVGIPDCVRQGQSVAASVVGHLAGAVSAAPAEARS
ncbi:MAG TPA: protoporphyrinogen oxidase [Roseiflexaceae bacterium]|nr:protoporphyrinogen oxidase [Roseiflexaceae bacterium]